VLNIEKVNIKTIKDTIKDQGYDVEDAYVEKTILVLDDELKIVKVKKMN